MPKHIEPRHRIVDFLYEAGVEALDARHAGAALALAAEQHESRAPEDLTGQPARDARDEIKPFLLGHCADDTANDGSGWPTALTPPVARPLHHRCRQSGVDDFDSISRYSRFHHHRSHRVRDCDEGVDAVPVLETNLLWRKGDAAGH